MCLCKGFSETEEANCKCPHATVYMTGEKRERGTMMRTWVCRQEGCNRSWVVDMGFESQDHLEGRR